METNRDDRIIAEVRAVRDEYAARHDHDIAAIFRDIGALQEASGRAFVRYVEPLAKAMAPVATQMSTVLRQLEVSLGSFIAQLKELSDALAPKLAKLAPYLPAFREWNQVVDALLEVGWLPYHSAPFHYVEECGDDLRLLETRFASYYRTEWSQIRDDMESRLEDYHIDDEARATFREALSAHEAGNYRCVCRVLFPEIERVIGVGGRVPSKRMLKELTGTRDLADLAFRERFGWVLFGRLVDHAYEQVDEGDLHRFERDPVPNRHAAMHGLVSYSTHKHSMNMLILTDYIFQILPQENGSQA